MQLISDFLALIWANLTGTVDEYLLERSDDKPLGRVATAKELIR